jgi:hypothetical protein
VFLPLILVQMVDRGCWPDFLLGEFPLLLVGVSAFLSCARPGPVSFAVEVALGFGFLPKRRRHLYLLSRSNRAAARSWLFPKRAVTCVFSLAPVFCASAAGSAFLCLRLDFTGVGSVPCRALNPRAAGIRRRGSSRVLRSVLLLLPRFQCRARQGFGGRCFNWDFSLARTGFGTR